MEIKGKTIAFLGDSITEGVGASSLKQSYVQVFEKITGANVLNYGISGTRIAPQIKPSEDPRHDLDFISRIKDIDESADAVIVFGGTNDFGHGDAPFGMMGDKTENTFCGSCYVLMKMLVEKYPLKPIIFITPLHRVGEDKTVNRIGIQCKTLKSYVNIIRETAEYFSIPVLDLYSNSGMQPNIEEQNKMYFKDGLHPNDLGHERISNIIKTFLETNIS